MLKEKERNTIIERALYETQNQSYYINENRERYYDQTLLLTFDLAYKLSDWAAGTIGVSAGPQFGDVPVDPGVHSTDETTQGCIDRRGHTGTEQKVARRANVLPERNLLPLCKQRPTNR